MISDCASPMLHARVFAMLAVLITGFLNGCAAPATGSQAASAPVVPAPLIDETTCISGKSFAAEKVRHLSTDGFDFPANGFTTTGDRTSYSRPNSTDDVGERQKSQLTAAFLRMPTQARSLLCKDVTNVFVDDRPDNFGGAGSEASGWAFWEVKEKGQADGSRRYIAISSASLNADRDRNQNPLRSLAALETGTMSALLGNPPLSLLPKITVDNDGADVALAAVLLHELGHIAWYENCFQYPVDECRAFNAIGWRGDIKWPPTGIHEFGRDLGSVRNDGDPNFTGISEIVGNNTKLRRFLRLDDDGLKSGTRWPTVMSGLAQDEDFVETFKVLSLDACKTHIMISFGGVHRSSTKRDLHTASDLKAKSDIIRRILKLPARSAC